MNAGDQALLSLEGDGVFGDFAEENAVLDVPVNGIASLGNGAVDGLQLHVFRTHHEGHLPRCIHRLGEQAADGANIGADRGDAARRHGASTLPRKRLVRPMKLATNSDVGRS